MGKKVDSAGLRVIEDKWYKAKKIRKPLSSHLEQNRAESWVVPKSPPDFSLLIRAKRKIWCLDTRRPEFWLQLLLMTLDKLPILFEFLLFFSSLKKPFKWEDLARWFKKKTTLSFKISWLFSCYFLHMTDPCRSCFKFPVAVIWADQSDDSQECSESIASSPLGH